MEIPVSLKMKAVDLEKKIVKSLVPHLEIIQKEGGEKLADEFLLSIVCLLQTRAVSIIHVATGESINSIRRRMNTVLDREIEVMLAKIRTKLGEQRDVIGELTEDKIKLKL